MNDLLTAAQFHTGLDPPTAVRLPVLAQNALHKVLHQLVFLLFMRVVLPRWPVMPQRRLDPAEFEVLTGTLQGLQDLQVVGVCHVRC